MGSQQVISLDTSTPLTVISSGVTSVNQVPSPGVSAYIFSVGDVPGVVAANNFLTIYNPVGSGKTISAAGIFISCSATGAAAVTAPMRAFRIGAAPTGGTVQASSAICKGVSASANSIADVRIGNPTATGLAPFLNSPAFTTGASGTGQVHQAINVPGSAFTLVPGEGILLQTLSGTANQRWNISVAWGEF